jgi:anti-sigma-K factor RskA
MYAGLPTLPAGQTYQMWIIAGGVPTSAVVLPVGVSGGTSLFPLVSGADTFAITREPASGSPAPTSDPLATVSLS